MCDVPPDEHPTSSYYNRVLVYVLYLTVVGLSMPAARLPQSFLEFKELGGHISPLLTATAVVVAVFT